MQSQASAGPEGPTYRLHRNPWIWAFLAGIICITMIRPLLRREPDPPPMLYPLPSFELIDTSGAGFGSEELKGRVWVANMIFTRCTSICPRLTAAMGALQKRYEKDQIGGVHLVSVSVDPEFDSPEVLAAYGVTHEIDPQQWSLLTGETEQVRRLVVDGFRTALGRPEEIGENLIDIAHTGKLILVDDQGNVRGYYDSDAMGLDEVFHRSLHVLREARRR